MFQTSTRTPFQGYEATVAYSKMNCAWRLFIKSFCLKTCPKHSWINSITFIRLTFRNRYFVLGNFLSVFFKLYRKILQKKKLSFEYYLSAWSLKPLSRSSDTSYKLSFVLVYVYFRVMSFTSDKSPISCSLNFFLTNILVRHQCLTKNPHCS